MDLSKSVLSFLVGLATCAGVAHAQCPTPDKLDGGACCATASPNLPDFPGFLQQSIEICWLDCNVNAITPYVARWKNLPIFGGSVGGGTVPPPCGENLASLELRRPGGAVDWRGTLRLQYSRTWQEAGPGGFAIQVWRFLANGDLQAVSTTATTPCPIPSCAAAFGGNVRFTGYVDYATSCALVPTTYQHAWMLTHVCDAIDHAPGFPRAGAFHPNRTYSIVGPAAGFVPGPLQPLEGTAGSAFEALRKRVLSLPPAPTASCVFEESANHTLAAIFQFCQCGLPGTNQYNLGNLNVVGSCGTTVTTPGGPMLPGFLSMGIGTWTAPGVYPGVEALRWNAGDYRWTDGCTGAARQEIFFGVTTIGGFPARQVLSVGIPALLPPIFIDQSNSLPLPAGGATVMNVPYVSDHFLNLNH